MPLSRRVCAGWGDAEGPNHHPCGKVLGHIETATGGDTHTMCALPEADYRQHMAACGLPREEIEKALQDAGIT